MKTLFTTVIALIVGFFWLLFALVPFSLAVFFTFIILFAMVFAVVVCAAEIARIIDDLYDAENLRHGLRIFAESYDREFKSKGNEE